MVKISKRISFILLRSFRVLIFLFATSNANAQVIKIKGRILDVETSEAIPFANIFIKSLNLGVLSDLEGNYTIQSATTFDSLSITCMGYASKSISIRKDSIQKINIFLTPEQTNMQEVVITAFKEDPAYDIVRKIISHKANNHKGKLASYKYESYSKIKFGIKNLDDQFRNKRIFRPFKFVFDNIDSTEETPYLPVFFTESLSDIYYKNPLHNERVKASKATGLKNESMSTVFSGLIKSMYVYDDFLNLFGKNFISPISRSCFNHYKYELLDSAFKNQHWSYKIKYLPRRKQELTFSGIFWVADTSYAITEIDGILPGEANINFITSMRFRQTYTEVDDHAWMISSDQVLLNGELFIPHELKAQKFFAKKYSSFNKFIINPVLEDTVFAREGKIFEKGASEKDLLFWETARHDSLSRTEQNLYALVDSIKHIPLFKNYIAIFTGYKPLGIVEIGPYYKFYTYNPVEGSRIRLGFRSTPKLNKNILLDGYTAYGFRDEKIKYGGGAQYYFNKNPRAVLGAGFKHDVEQLGWSQNTFRAQDNLLYTIFKINPNNKLNRVNEGKIFLEKEWFKGFSTRLMFRRSVIEAAGKLHYERETGNDIINVTKIHASEISFYTHFGYKEKFLSGDYNRISLGSAFPIFDAMYTASFKGIKSDYEYQKLVIAIKQKFNFKTIGYSKFRMEAGKIWGTAPFPLLELPSGNRTFFYDEMSYNTMNFFEFVNDQYASIFFAHHFDGFLFNRLPLIRNLKWREVLTAKGIVGSLKDTNKNALVLPEKMYGLQKPFYEAGFGIENIFRILRIDAVWRLSYLDHPDVKKFAVKGSIHIDF